MKLRVGGTVLSTNMRACRLGSGLKLLFIAGTFMIMTLYFLGKIGGDSMDDSGDTDTVLRRNRNRKQAAAFPPDPNSKSREIIADDKNSTDFKMKPRLLGYLAGQVSMSDSTKVSKKENPTMVMAHARDRYKNILQFQKKILKEQVRPPDKRYNINVTLSDIISMDRPIDDTRSGICQKFEYDSHKLPQATVVIPFFNEALSMLLRTIHSILNRSPDHLLREVILVDDRSTNAYLKESFGDYIRLLPKTRLLRNTKREGLIRSRLLGAQIAKSPVVIFLDAHTEANEGWLEPMLHELQIHPSSIVQPFVDGIDAWTIKYSAPPTIYKGAFSWDLR